MTHVCSLCLSDRLHIPFTSRCILPVCYVARPVWRYGQATSHNLSWGTSIGHTQSQPSYSRTHACLLRQAIMVPAQKIPICVITQPAVTTQLYRNSAKTQPTQLHAQQCAFVACSVAGSPAHSAQALQRHKNHTACSTVLHAQRLPPHPPGWQCKLNQQCHMQHRLCLPRRIHTPALNRWGAAAGVTCTSTCLATCGTSLDAATLLQDAVQCLLGSRPVNGPDQPPGGVHQEHNIGQHHHNTHDVAVDGPRLQAVVGQEGECGI